MLSKKRQKKIIVKGLYSGADDYVTKPFSMSELEARIMRVLNSVG
jgi:DNA-binding response OmpR family regulator